MNADPTVLSQLLNGRGWRGIVHAIGTGTNPSPRDADSGVVMDVNVFELVGLVFAAGVVVAVAGVIKVAWFGRG